MKDNECMRIRPYEKLIVWQRAHILCLQIYQITRSFPNDEKFGLTSQIRRSMSSIPTNIVEGANKKSQKERERFYETATCSLEETHYHLLLAKDLGYITNEMHSTVVQRLENVGFLLGQLRKALRYS